METSENILVARAQSGSEDAFAELARKHSGQIYKHSLRILHNREDAEDNSQNVLLQAVAATSTVSRANHNFQLGSWGSL